MDVDAFRGGSALGRVHELPVLRSELLMHDRGATLKHALLPDDEGVGRYAALNHELAEPVGGRDVDDVSVAGVGVEREEHAGGRDI